MATSPATAPAAAPMTLGAPLWVQGTGLPGSAGIPAAEGVGGRAARGKRAAGVEADPAEPQERRAEHGHGRVVRLERLGAEALAPPQDQRRDEGRHAAGGVDDRAARDDGAP